MDIVRGDQVRPVGSKLMGQAHPLEVVGRRVAEANDLQVLGAGLGQVGGSAAAAHQWMQATRGGAEAVRGIDRAGDAVRGARMLRRARQADRIKDLVVVGRNTARVVPAGLRAVRGARALRKVRVGASKPLARTSSGTSRARSKEIFPRSWLERGSTIRTWVSTRMG